MPKTRIVFISILLVTTLACNALMAPTSPTVVPKSTTIIEVVSTPTAVKIPLTEAEVPRVSLEEARVAIESGAAVVVDVRSRDAYNASHIPGAINIQFGEFETNPIGLGLDKDQWIITYCT